ncbi:MAG: YbaB/EbfC family nucleoid-associated protein [Pyrinomonadaceae bacterium]|nr:YbaB/EbfC family nucleoid-associated protein [Phycisphaerales bacterium]
MLDSLKMAGTLAGLMKNKEGLKKAGERVKHRLSEIRVVGQAGAGAVRVTVDGKMHVHAVELMPALATHLTSDPAGRAMAESLIAEATNDAIGKAQVLAQKEIQKEAEALGLPAIPGLEGLLGS